MARCPRCGNDKILKEKITIREDCVVREYYCPRCREFDAPSGSAAARGLH